MHDPMTQAFVIPYGWRTETFKNGRKWRYYKPLITIWHVDPELRGSDDSCGWSRPTMNTEMSDIVNSLAGDESRDPWYFSLSAEKNMNPVECESYLRGAFLMMSKCLVNRKQLKRAVTIEEATQWASELIHNSVDNFRSSLAFKSGYHSNWYDPSKPNNEEQDKHWREQQAKGFFSSICRYILRERRPWYRHPKWHFWHWKLQVHAVQQFKRWAFSRCSICNRGFKFGESPCTNQWDSGGPLWFRSESGMFHMACDDSRKPQPQPDKSGVESE